ncbi:MAG: adenylate/guanylate cyclase domain-containing protein [Spirochaetes bacterium]|nr:MAG: adenylate/guanylate cyclase domain-containing protein [Spirochaetota bacterium]
MKVKEKVYSFTPESIENHALWVRERYQNKPAFAAEYLTKLLEVNGIMESGNPSVQRVKKIIEDFEENALAALSDGLNKSKNDESVDDLEKASREIYFRKQIEEFYLPKQLVDAIMENGEIPDKSEESIIGIGFLDIADYTYLSKFLTPMENQIVLNGLYAAFSWVLQRRGGYLNKIEGDSLMFHFGGNIDPNVKGLTPKETEDYIARELFYTCVEMQRVAFQFNEANKSFLYGNKNEDIQIQIEKAFDIISTMRNSEFSQSINAFFQIRIRIGANIGEVTMGNFGPEGSKQWDVIGVPVIKAKRMESTAPIGGFRISEELYRVLKENGIVDDYYRRFKREAQALFGSFSNITMDELFKYNKVTLKEKKGAEFITYSIQVNPGLPEAIMKQVDLLLNRGEDGADRIVNLLQYYRGNKFVISKIESAFKERSLRIRVGDIYNFIFPKKYTAMVKAAQGNRNLVDRNLEEKYSLFDIFELLGSLQDTLKTEFEFKDKPVFSFNSYDKYMDALSKWVIRENSVKEKRVYQRNYFYNYVFPMVFLSIRTSILEYQHKTGELTEV